VKNFRGLSKSDWALSKKLNSFSVIFTKDSQNFSKTRERVEQFHHIAKHGNPLLQEEKNKKNSRFLPLQFIAFL